ncbi:Casein kinase I isoform delta, partial [Perkinsus olseni]
MSRACPEPLPEKANTGAQASTTTESSNVKTHAVQVADSDGSGLPMIKLSLSTPSSDLTQSDNCIGTEALLDSGAEQPLCAEDEFNRWCNAGLNLPLLPDSRTIIF